MEQEKYVDESWKETAEQQKETVIKPDAESKTAESSSTDAEQPDDFTITFVNYTSSLAFQAMVFLGEVPNPVSGQIEKNLDQSKFLIDTLAMLKEKTKGNLDEQEANMLNAAVYELQMKFVEVKEKENTAS